MRMARNVVAHEPEPDPANVDPEQLRARGWPETLIKRIERNRRGSQILREFEERFDPKAL